MFDLNEMFKYQILERREDENCQKVEEMLNFYIYRFFKK